MGHISYPGLQELYIRNMLKAPKVDLASKKGDCILCTQGKLSTSPYRPTSHNMTNLGELTHVNLWGKYPVASINKNHYFILMINDASQHIMI
jgi:hypothetical protein